jgi:predicted N-acetyltransferase YhbS
MHRQSIEDHCKAIGLWRGEGGKIMAMAHDEDGRGDVFLEFADPGVETEALISEMLDFAERNCSFPRGQGRGFALRVPQNERLFEDIAVKRGYSRIEWGEPLCEVMLEPAFLSRPMPPGLSLLSGEKVDPRRKAIAHARAFGYEQRDGAVEDSARAFESLLTAPDYRGELDLALADTSGEILSFVGLWADLKNRVGILEPVGTIPEHRRKGLAAGLIAEGARRLRALGVSKLYVGSDQPFYLAIGFKPVIRQDIWEYKG